MKAIAAGVVVAVAFAAAVAFGYANRYYTASGDGSTAVQSLPTRTTTNAVVARRVK